jgi:hypothetical protein
VAGDYAYVADDVGLRIVDVANPATPAEIGFCDTPGSAVGVALAENYAYVADGYGGLRIVNVANPAAPTDVGFCHTPGYAYGVAVVGDYAFVADYGNGLRIIDVSNPAAPSEVGFYDTPGYAYGVAVTEDYAFVADEAAGLIILRLLRDRVSVTIPVDGGSLTSTNGDAQFVFPAGAITATVNLTYRHMWTDQDTGALAGIGRTFDLSAVYSDTGQVAQLASGQSFTATLHYTDTELGSAIEGTLALYAWDSSQWVREPTSVLDASANTLSAMPNHLGMFAALGETHRLFLPVAMRRM